MLVMAAAVTSTVVWWGLHRWWFMSGDDYLLVTQGGDVGGRFSFRQWLGFLADEWLRVNGRTSDSLLRAVLRPGQWFYPLFAPLMFTVTGLAVGFWLAATRRPGDRCWLVCLGLLVVPTVGWLVPGASGDAIFWTAGAMNYVLPLGAAAGGLAVLVRVLDGAEVPWPGVVLAGLWLMFTDSLQEIVSTTLGAVAVMVVITAWGRLSSRVWVMTGMMAAAFAVHMSAPGLWARSGSVAEASETSGVTRVIQAAAASASHLSDRVPLLWLALIVLLMVCAAVHRELRGAVTVAVGGLVLVGPLGSMYLTRMTASLQRADGSLVRVVPYGALLVGVLAIAFLATWWVLAKGVRLFGWGPVVAWLAFVGSNVFVLGSGALTERVHFLPTALLLVVVVSLLSVVTRDVAEVWRRVVALGLVVVLGHASLVWVDRVWVGLQANHEFVTERILQPLRSAAPGSHVVVPNVLPVPTMSYGNAFLMPRYEKALKTYHGLPDDLTITNP